MDANSTTDSGSQNGACVSAISPETRTRFRAQNLESKSVPLFARLILFIRMCRKADAISAPESGIKSASAFESHHADIEHDFRVQNLESKSRPRFSWLRPTFQASARNNRCADPRLEGWRGCPRRGMILRGGMGRGEERRQGCGHTQNFHRPDCVDIKIAFARP